LEENIFWVQAYFWREISIFGARTLGGRKEAYIKIRNRSMQKEEKHHGTHENKCNHVRVRVFDKILIDII
jgi:hypothetical protein